MSALKLVVSSHAGNHFSLQSHSRLRVSITSSFSSNILEKEFSCTDVMLLLLRSSLLNLSSPINAFFVTDFKWFAANPNFSNRFNPTNTPLISSMVVAIRLKFSSLKSTFNLITYLHKGFVLLSDVCPAVCGSHSGAAEVSSARIWHCWVWVVPDVLKEYAGTPCPTKQHHITDEQYRHQHHRLWQPTVS